LIVWKTEHRDVS